MSKWLWALLTQIAGPAQDIIADTVMFGIAAVCHGLLGLCMRLMMPNAWERAHLMIEEGVFVAFAIIYAALLYDIVAVFIPYFRRMPRRQYDLPFNGSKA